MARKSSTSVKINPNVRCMKIYPSLDTDRSIRELKTIGILLNRDQAVHLARTLLAVTQDWELIDITGFRFKQNKSNGTYPLTITSSTPSRKK